MTKPLLEGGADPNTQNKTNGMTALHYAACYGMGCELQESLFAESGADSSIRDNYGRTAYDLDE